MAAAPQEADAPNEIQLCTIGSHTGKPEVRLYLGAGDGQRYEQIRLEVGDKRVSMTPEQWANLGVEAENLRIQLAACGVIAMCNTPESAKLQRPPEDSPYWCASLRDVANAVDREMKLSSEVKRLRQVERETTVDERCTWGECPSCGAKHGERCNPDVGLAIGYAVGGGPPRDGVHRSRIQLSPMRVRVVPA
jgi:hypothetical protein